jgi:hypothetical protein
MLRRRAVRRELAVEHPGQAQHVVALALQGHAQRTNPVRSERLAQPQLRDDEVEQFATFLGMRAGQRQHVVPEPAGQGRDVGRQVARLHLGLPRPSQTRGQLASIARVLDRRHFELEGLAPRRAALGLACQHVGHRLALLAYVEHVAVAGLVAPGGDLAGTQPGARVGHDAWPASGSLCSQLANPGCS